MPMWHTNIVSRKSWVSTTRRLNSQFSDMERESSCWLAIFNWSIPIGSWTSSTIR